MEYTEDELTGNTHLEPAYRPEWGNSNPDWEDGQIHLEGEFDFPADQPAREIAKMLRERAEQIGGVVTHDRTNGNIDVYPWNGPGYFRLRYDVDDEGARISEITVFDGVGKPASHDTVEELKERGEVSSRIVEHIESADDVEEGGLFRITGDGLVPVDEDDIGL